MTLTLTIFAIQIRLLDATSGAELSVLDLSRSVVGGELAHNRQLVSQPSKPRPDLAFGKLQVWREPNLSWIDATGKRSIVSMESSTKSLPATIPTLRVDMASAQPKCGICLMQWNKAGTLLASRNGQSQLKIDLIDTVLISQSFARRKHANCGLHSRIASGATRTSRSNATAISSCGPALRFSSPLGDMAG